MPRAHQVTEQPDKMDTPGEVFRRRPVFEPALTNLRSEGKGEEPARPGNGSGKGSDSGGGKMDMRGLGEELREIKSRGLSLTSRGW